MNNTLSNGLRILELLADSQGGLGVRAIARHLDLGLSTAHRLLRTLTDAGYVTQHRVSKKYGLTLKIWGIGSRYAANWSIREIAAPHMRDLAGRIDETVHLSILYQMQVLYIDKIDSKQPVRAYSQVGGRAPAYCVATGKVLLAFTPPAQSGLDKLALEPFTPDTITDHAMLKWELNTIRRQQYAVNRGEWRQGVAGIAAPVRNIQGRTVCAIGVSGPVERLTGPASQNYPGIVMRVAAAMSGDMGLTAVPDFSAGQG